MKIPRSTLAPIGFLICVSLGSSFALPIGDEPSSGIPDFLELPAPELGELLATNMPVNPSYSCPPSHNSMPAPAHTYTAPPVKIPTPPDTHHGSQAAVEAARRAQEAALQAQQMAAQQHLLHITGITVYAATKLQRKVAEDHARAFMALWKKVNADAELTSAPGRSERRLAGLRCSTTSKSPQTQKSKKRRHRRRHHKKLPRYIAVDTVKDKHSPRGAKRTVMLWDTQNESLVGNNVYDVKDVPPIGKTLVFETYSADYVGAGNQIPADLRPEP